MDQGQSNQNPTESDQIKPNPTKKIGPARIKAQAVGSRLARSKLDFGRARWRRGKADRVNAKAKGLRACFKINRGPVFGQKAGWRGAATTEQLRWHSRAGRSQAALCPKNPPAAGPFALGRVGS